MNKVIKIGEFTVESGSIVISDPCREISQIKDKFINNVKNGTWKAYFFKDKAGVNVELLAVHTDRLKVSEAFVFNYHLQDLAVDSGQVVIVDALAYGKKEGLPEEHLADAELMSEQYGTEVFFEVMCRLTNNNDRASAFSSGVVSASGYGDGIYPADGILNEDDEIEGIRVLFDEE